MILLSPYLTVLRVGMPSGTLLHSPIWPEPADSKDMRLDLPRIEKATDIPGLPGFQLQPGDGEGMVRIGVGNRDVCVHPLRGPAFTRDVREGRFFFRLATDADLAHLRTLFTHAWARGDEADAAEITLVAGEDFCLDGGDVRFDLRRAMPRPLAEDGSKFELAGEGARVTLRRLGPARQEILLRRAPPAVRPPPAASQAEFAATPDRFLTVPGTEEISMVPMTVCQADLHWLYENPFGNQDQRIGRQRYAPIVARASGRHVILARFLEGMIFGETGVLSETGYLDNLGSGGGRHLPMPPGMRQEGERFFVNKEFLADMPRLEGPHIVFYGGTLPNYAHWLIDSMLPLHFLLPFAPREARLLLPATLRGFAGNPTRICDHHDILRAFGFAGLPSVEIAAPYAWVEDVYWVENGWIANMPGEHVRSLRDHVASLRPAPARGMRQIYIARRGTRLVANAAHLERFLQAKGFETHYLDEMSIDAQIDLFSQASWVVSPHGAELGNLLFCRPGTKVLELAPDSDFKPYFSYICNKLALTHGILPCPTHDGTFSGNMNVDMEKFTALYRMLKSRL